MSFPGESEQKQREQAAIITGVVVSAVVERQREISETRWRVLGGVVLRLVLLAVCGYVLWRVRTILTTVIIASVVASAAGALVDPLMRVRIRFPRLMMVRAPGQSVSSMGFRLQAVAPKTQRMIITALVFLLLFAGLFASVHFMVRPFQMEWTQLKTNWPHYQASLEKTAVQAKVWFNGLPPDVREFLIGLKEKQSSFSPTAWLGNLLGATLSWASHVVELILVPVLAFYFTVDGRALRSELLFFIPKGRLRSTMAIINESGEIMRAYIVAQFWLAVIAGVFVGVGLAVLGMPYALILGIIAGVTRAIPVIGPLLGGIPVIALSFLYGAQQGNPYLWVGVATFFTILHLVESKIIMPHFLGHRLHLHAVVILVALLIGGEFFGLMGMFLAAPLAALARVLIMHFFVFPRRRAERNERAAKEVLALSTANGNPTTPPLRLTTVSGGSPRLARALRADATRRVPDDAA